jgi:hypothetical protein
MLGKHSTTEFSPQPQCFLVKHCLSFKIKNKPAWVCRPVILALQRLKQEDLEFEVKLGYIVRTCLKIQNIKTHKKTT